MAPLTTWLRSLGNDGAVSNARRASTEPLQQAAALEARLALIPGSAGTAPMAVAGRTARARRAVA